MSRAFLQGLRVALHSWPLALTLWLVSLLFAAAFASASACWLAQVLDGSMATRRLYRDLDPNVLVDLYHHHGASFRLLLVSAGLLAALYVIVWVWFHGAIVATVRANGKLKLRDSLRDGLDLAPIFGRLLVVAASALTMLSGAVGAAAWWLVRRSSAGPSEMTRYYIIGIALLIWLMGAALLTAVHDHARLRAAAAGSRALAAYWSAMRFVCAGGELAFPLALLLHAAGVVIWLVYQTASANISVTGRLGIGGSLLWGEVFLFARVGLRVWFFAAQHELQANAVLPASFKTRGTEVPSSLDAFALGSPQLPLPLE